MATNRTTAVGVFPNHAAAQRAIKRLREAGFRDDQIGLVAQDPENRYRDAESAEAEGSKAGTGAAAGAATGAGVGVLWGLGIVAGAIPAIGPAIAGGVLASVLASTAAGAAAGGLIGGLIGLGIPEEEAHYYEQQFQSGRTLVTVKNAERFAEARQIMHEESGYDYDTRDQIPTTEARQDRATPTGRVSTPNMGGASNVVYEDSGSTRR